MSKTSQNIKKKAVSTFAKGKEKAVNIVEKTTKTAANNPVKAFYVVGGLVAVYLGYKLVKNVSNKIDNTFGETDFNDTVDGTGQGDVTNATITDAQAINFASQLLLAFNETTFLIHGTDEKTIDNIFNQLKNVSDFLKVYKAFGKKHYNGNGSPATGWLDFVDFDIFIKELDLVGWLKAEISPSFDSQLYNKVKNIVEQAGFTF